MALSTFVKISNISSLSDARYCAGMGVDILGFNIDPGQENSLSETDFKEITDWLAGVKFAGEFHSSGLDDIKSSLKNYPIDYLEISSTSLVEPLALLGKPLIFRIQIDSEAEKTKLKSTLSYLDELVKMVVIKSNNPDLYSALDEMIAFYIGNIKLVKGYNVLPTDEVGNFPGLELEATKEEKPGFKDYGEIMDVLEVLDVD